MCFYNKLELQIFILFSINLNLKMFKSLQSDVNLLLDEDVWRE